MIPYRTPTDTALLERNSQPDHHGVNRKPCTMSKSEQTLRPSRSFTHKCKLERPSRKHDNGVGPLPPPAHPAIPTHSPHFFALPCVPRACPLATASPYSFALCFLVGFGQQKQEESQVEVTVFLLPFLLDPTHYDYTIWLFLDSRSFWTPVGTFLHLCLTGRWRASHARKMLVAFPFQPCCTCF